MATFWYGTVVTEKPARFTPGGDASGFVAQKGVEYKFDAEDGRWLRLVFNGLWVAKDWLTNIRMVEEDVTPPPTQGATIVLTEADGTVRSFVEVL